jgi:hypothetical protein
MTDGDDDRDADAVQLCMRCRTPLGWTTRRRADGRSAHPPGECPAIPDGGRAPDDDRDMTVQPATCPECGRTLDAAGECRVDGCPGPSPD